MNDKKKVIVFSTNTCPYCHMVKDYLKENNIEFEDINLSENPERANEMIEKSGQQGVPVILVDEDVVVGFDREKLKELLDLKE